MKTRRFFLLIALGIYFLVSLFLLPFSECQAAGPGSVIGPTGTNGANSHSFQRKGFLARGLSWFFYSSGQNMVYQTSTDGITWSSPAVIRACRSGDQFSVWFDGSYVHYAYSSASAASPLYYRRGIPQSAGSIHWGVEHIAVPGTSGTAYGIPCISVDSNGYPWIGYQKVTGTIKYPAIAKSSQNNGTWRNAPGFPFNLAMWNASSWVVALVPLLAGKMAAVYASPGHLLRGRSWNGSAWEGAFSTTRALTSVFFSAVAQGDNVHLAFLETSVIRHAQYSYSNHSLSEETIVQSGVTNTSAPALSIDSGGDLHLFWAGSPRANQIFYKQNSGGKWDSAPLLLVDESTERLTPSSSLTTFYNVDQGKAIFYLTKLSSPFHLKSSRGMAAISLTKTGPAKAYVGDTIHYQFGVKNTGKVPLSGVAVNDPLLGGAIRSIGNLGPGEATHFTASYRIPNHAPQTLVNTATVSGAYGSVPIEDSDSCAVSIVNPIEVKNDGPVFALEGDPLTFTYTVRNAWTQNLTITSLTHSGPGAPAYQGGDNGNKILEPEETWTYTAKWVPAWQHPAPLENTLTVRALRGNIDVSNEVTLKMFPVIIRQNVIGAEDDGEFEIWLKERTAAKVLAKFNVKKSRPQKLWLKDDTYFFKEVITYPSCYRLVPDNQYMVKYYPQYNSEFAQFRFDAGQKADWTFLTRTICTLGIEINGPAKACPGEAIQYRFKVANLGEVSVNQVKVTDPALGVNKDIGSLAAGAVYPFTANTLAPQEGDLKGTSMVSGRYGNTSLAASAAHRVAMEKCVFQGQICGIQFDDVNENGRREEGEAGAEGGQVSLFSGELTRLDSVDFGDPTSESGHNLQGWGPEGPTGSGENWGGIAADPLSPDKKARVVWYRPAEGTDERWASFTLQAGSSQNNLLKLRVLDGGGDDSFDVYVNRNLVYAFMGKNNPGAGGFNLFGDAAGPAETWRIHQIHVPDKGNLDISMVARGEPGAGFDAYGQLAIDWAELYALKPYPCSGNPATTRSDGAYCFVVADLASGASSRFYIGASSAPGSTTPTTPTVVGPVMLTAASAASHGNNFGLSSTAIGVEKYVSSDNKATWQDADDPPGPSVPSGSNLFFKIVVRNPSKVPLAQITLLPGDLDVSSCEVVDPLPPGGSFECLIGPVKAKGGPQKSAVIATGKANHQTHMDYDDTHYIGQDPPTLCTRTQGYWKNHPAAWPVKEMILGAFIYTQAQLLEIFDQPVQGNGLTSLAHQLIAAKLNAAGGVPVPLGVKEAIEEADALVGQLIPPPVGGGSLKPAQTEGPKDVLDAYNNGIFPGGPRHCP